MKKIEPYCGILQIKKMAALPARAYQSWQDQRKRCLNKKSRAWKWYGAKGIRVEYSSRDFIGWYLAEYKKRKWISPTVGRIDHSKNYSFENIEMQEALDNSRERTDRLGSPGIATEKPCVLIENSTNERLVVFKSLSEASRYTGLPNGRICNHCKGMYRIKPRSPFRFEYVE